ncbi:MAG: rhodanese-like domain-containing protein [Gammaproteobacteria bacterium]|nr:rhodanese-like domain-containing protein [Gammaproteobacteria bacterium]
MQELITFLSHHLLLSLALLVVVALIIVEEQKGIVRGLKKINVQQLTDLINHQEALVVDTRDAISFRSGHIIHAINVPAEHFNEQLNKLAEYKNRPLILVCSAGNDSVRLAKSLYAQGFGKLYSLTGGIAAWQRANFPLTKN